MSYSPNILPIGNTGHTPHIETTPPISGKPDPMTTLLRAAISQEHKEPVSLHEIHPIVLGQARDALEFFEAGIELGTRTAKLQNVDAGEAFQETAISSVFAPLEMTKKYLNPLMELFTLSDNIKIGNVEIVHFLEVINYANLAFVVVLDLPSKALTLIYKNSRIKFAEEIHKELSARREDFKTNFPKAAAEFDRAMDMLKTRIAEEKKAFNALAKDCGITTVAYTPLTITTIWQFIRSIPIAARLALDWAGAVFGVVVSYFTQKEATQAAATHKEWVKDLEIQDLEALVEKRQESSTSTNPLDEKHRKTLKEELLKLYVEKQTTLMRKDFDFKALMQRVVFGAEVVLALAICAISTAAALTAVGAVILFFPQIACAAVVVLSIGAALYYWFKYRPNMARTLARHVLANLYYPIRHTWSNWRVISAQTDFWNLEKRLVEIARKSLNGFDASALQKEGEELLEKINRLQDNLNYWENKMMDLKAEALAADLGDLRKNWTMKDMIKAIQTVFEDGNDALIKFFKDRLGLELNVEERANPIAIKKALLNSTFAKNHAELIEFAATRIKVLKHGQTSPAA